MINIDKKIKKLKSNDIRLIKISSMAFILFLITVLPSFHNLVMQVNWLWYFAIMVITAYIPLKKMFKK
ncbi:hypothetical protein HOD61_01000 [archaeon]|jgi:hypothetical protein|nr:hypothetical protein [archaeon]